MNKFEDVDVITSLEAIMKQNTAFFQNDFDLDRNILQKAAASPTAEDRRLLWFSRPSGTSCFRERDVFLKGTRQHNTWRFYGEQTRDKVLAYAVELTGIVNGKIKGNLYELDYPKQLRGVCVHCLRHTFAVHTLQLQSKRGIDRFYSVPILSTYMGHTDIYGTELYLRLTPECYEHIVDCAEKDTGDIFPEVLP